MTISVADVHFRYTFGTNGELTEHGLSDITFSAEAGTLTVLCGASGSGKTTGLRLLNGLVPNFHLGTLTGTVTVGGTDVPNQPLHDALLTSATVFQNPRTQFFTDEVTSELAFGNENLGIPAEDTIARIRTAAKETNTEHLIGCKLNELSGGQTQRVACAAAIASHAPVLLFDEPSSNLSPDAIDDLHDILAHQKAAGRTIVVAEHRLYFLRDLADQVLYFRDGRLAHRFTGAEFFALSDAQRRELGLRRIAPPEGTHPPAPPKGSTGLQLENIRFSYLSKQILDIPEASFPAGAITALTGPNGCGKTTLARLLCGLSSPARGGTISINGTPMRSGARTKASYIVMQDVSRQLFAAAVEDEITLGHTANEREAIDVATLLAQLDLDGLEDRHPQSLSGGQRQRLVIASAMAQNKQVHILDEPTSGVGQAHLVAIAERMRQLADAGAVVIVITHDEELIEECADYVVHLPDINRKTHG
ncbi:MULTISPECIES: ABC transporter ATP-binding protein [Corynebacterium]|uniref:ABC transporter ATP-binding protein n=1 Tax=Corynebacterium TaxID=1716 RepID=UPI00124CB960|nr:MULTISPECIES: ABC transporter ATP-binding protein [Corynebacterium]